jgi:hypothetical protein
MIFRTCRCAGADARQCKRQVVARHNLHKAQVAVHHGVTNFLFVTVPKGRSTSSLVLCMARAAGRSLLCRDRAGTTTSSCSISCTTTCASQSCITRTQTRRLPALLDLRWVYACVLAAVLGGYATNVNIRTLILTGKRRFLSGNRPERAWMTSAIVRVELPAINCIFCMVVVVSSKQWLMHRFLVVQWMLGLLCCTGCARAMLDPPPEIGLQYLPARLVRNDSTCRLGGAVQREACV